jgi:hypothetical protein
MSKAGGEAAADGDKKYIVRHKYHLVAQLINFSFHRFYSIQVKRKC